MNKPLKDKVLLFSLMYDNRQVGAWRHIYRTRDAVANLLKSEFEIIWAFDRFYDDGFLPTAGKIIELNLYGELTHEKIKKILSCRVTHMLVSDIDEVHFSKFRAHLKDVRVVKTVNFGYPSGSVGWIRSLVGRIRRKISPSPVSAYITQSTGQGKFLNRYYGVHPDLIHVIPHAVDVDGFKRVVSHVRTGESTVTKVLTVSALRKEKGILRLLKVASRVKWHYARHDISFVIVGGGFMLKEFIDFSQKLDVTDVLVFAGHSDNVIDFYNSADIFFSPSDIESFSLASAEAMAMELPLVATRTHGLEDLVSPDITGFLHDLDDIDGMAISIIRYADDPALRSAHGSSGRQKIMGYAGLSEEAIAISKVIRGNQ